MSLPGCTDQTLHADSPHLVVHTHLPPHYCNLFVPAAVTSEGSNPCEYVGQTAFVAGSHFLSVCRRVMKGAEKAAADAAIAAVATDTSKSNPDWSAASAANTKIELQERLMRPHLNPGDALIFDTRCCYQSYSHSVPIHPARIMEAFTI